METILALCLLGAAVAGGCVTRLWVLERDRADRAEALAGVFLDENDALVAQLAEALAAADAPTLPVEQQRAFHVGYDAGRAAERAEAEGRVITWG